MTARANRAQVIAVLTSDPHVNILHAHEKYHSSTDDERAGNGMDRLMLISADCRFGLTTLEYEKYLSPSLHTEPADWHKAGWTATDVVNEKTKRMGSARKSSSSNTISRLGGARPRIRTTAIAPTVRSRGRERLARARLAGRDSATSCRRQPAPRSSARRALSDRLLTPKVVVDPQR
jgi:hypothetical protein